MLQNAYNEFDWISCHAWERAVKCNISTRDIFYVMDHGRSIYRTGIEFCFLGDRDIPQDHQNDSRITELVGTTLLIAQDGTLITVYRNPDGLRTIKRKCKYFDGRKARKGTRGVRFPLSPQFPSDDNLFN